MKCNSLGALAKPNVMKALTMSFRVGGSIVSFVTAPCFHRLPIYRLRLLFHFKVLVICPSDVLKKLK